MKLNTPEGGLLAENQKNRWIWYVFLPICAGLIFSGYLSAVKIFTQSCAFNEPCPYFIGYPACWYGFAMYFAMFLVTSGAVINKSRQARALKIDIGVSAIGIIFAGSFTIKELVQSGIIGKLGLSTCAYGLIFYILIFALSIIAHKKLVSEPVIEQK